MRSDTILVRGIPIDAPLRANRLDLVGVLTWLTVVAAGMAALVHYATAPGRPATVAASWPNETALELAEGRLTLLMFVHPHCVCSRASLHQLARVLATLRTDVAVRGVFYCPRNEPETWAHTQLWQLAAQLSAIKPMIDRGGREAIRFGVTTSGHVLLFTATGQRLYSGGITSGRGHEGDNLGCEAIQRLARAKPVERSEFPVFGCTILADTNRAAGD